MARVTVTTPDYSNPGVIAPWIEGDVEQIRDLFKIPIVNLGLLVQAMNDVANASPQTVYNLQTKLEKLADNETSRETFLLEDKRALKKADVLEWDVSLRGAGIDEVKADLKAEIAAALNLKAYGIGVESWGVYGTLGRS